MGITKKRIRELASEARPSRRPSTNNCQQFVHMFSLALQQEESIPHERVIYDVNPDAENSTPHAALRIPCEYIDDVSTSSGFLLVDLALDQFSTENYEQGEVEVALGDEDDFDPVMLFEPSDSRRQKWYQRELQREQVGGPSSAS